jgi:GntR family transcriptional regulator, transcriptional repressor for pyruvate dehydrogenase complex
LRNIVDCLTLEHLRIDIAYVASTPATEENRSKLSSRTATAIRKAIVEGRLKDGNIFPPEREMLQAWPVSRPAFREAVRIIESEDLLSVSLGLHGRARIHAASPSMIARAAAILQQSRDTPPVEVLAARLLIEPSAVALAAKRGRQSAVVLKEHHSR